MSQHERYQESDPLDTHDAVVLTDLRRVLARVDPVPAGLVERSLFALTLEGLHVELMELRRLEMPALGVRAGEAVEARTVTFTADHVTVMITLSTTEAHGVRIDGWVAPAGRFTVTVRRLDGTLETETDDDGSFVLADIAPGPASLVLRPLDDSSPAVSTPVIDL